MIKDWITPDWPAPANVRAVSTTRIGGVSKGAYASFNLGAHVGDDPRAVAENRLFLRSELNLPREPHWLTQVHGAQTKTFPLSPLRGEGRVRGDEITPPSPPPSPASGRGGEYWPPVSNQQLANRAADARESHSDMAITGIGDAAVTQRAGEICAILTADCLPVLLCDRAGKTVAAAHCGWRGLAAGVLENTLAAMRVPPGEIVAWLGPAIGPGAYEVGEEVRAALVRGNSEAEQAFEPVRSGKWLCDLYLLASQRLRCAGVTHIYGGGFCTYSERERFFSYRRDGECGRMATLIWLS